MWLPKIGHQETSAEGYDILSAEDGGHEYEREHTLHPTVYADGGKRCHKREDIHRDFTKI